MLTFHQPFPSGRILAQSSEAQVGTIMPGTPITWSLTVPGSVVTGKARTELAAKTALNDAWRDWCARAGLARAA